MASVSDYGFPGDEKDECPWYSGLGFSFGVTDYNIDNLAARDALLQPECVLFYDLDHFSVARNHPEFCK